MSGYFGEQTMGVPGEVTLARVVLVGSGVAQLIAVAWGMFAQGADAQWLGEALGLSTVTFIGAVFGLLIRRGRAWVRWAATAIGAIWCASTMVYVISVGPSYLSKLIVPAVVITAVHLPAARRYFAKEA